MKVKVEHFFDTEEEAKLFEENAMTAFDIWRYQTGKLKKPKAEEKEENG